MAWWLQTETTPNWKVTALGTEVLADCCFCKIAHGFVLDDVREVDNVWLGVSTKDGCDCMQVIDPGLPKTGHEKQDRINRSLLWMWEKGLGERCEKIRQHAMAYLKLVDEGWTPSEAVQLGLGESTKS